MAPKWTYFLTRFRRAGEPNRIRIRVGNQVGMRTISIFRVIQNLNLESLQVWIYIIRAGLHARRFCRIRLGHVTAKSWTERAGKSVGVVAGLVKVANGQTDRLARILWLRGH